MAGRTGGGGGGGGIEDDRPAKAVSVTSLSFDHDGLVK